MTKQVDTIIVGAGQAGLSTSYYLKQQGREHIILEQSPQAAKAWRERWDSFTFITPNWMIQLPGAEYQGNEPDAFMARDNIINYFETYIKKFQFPISFGVRVASVQQNGKGYLVRTNKTNFIASNVVIATGLYQHTKIPQFSKNLSSQILQLHSSVYRNPGQLPAGAVLVVGSAQSGSQIAEELYQTGRKVYLAVGSSGRVPRRYRNMDITYWLDKVGIMDMPTDKLPSPKARFAGSFQGTGKDGGHTINLYQFARDGVTLLGHIEKAQDFQIALATDLQENLIEADQFEADLVKQIDAYINKNGLDYPLEVLPKLRDGFVPEDIYELDLRQAGINSIIWATGYAFEFSFVRLSIFDDFGYPVQKRGVTECPGLYFVGLPFLHTVKSGLLYGVGGDAAYVAEHIGSRIPQTTDQ